MQDKANLPKYDNVYGEISIEQSEIILDKETVSLIDRKRI